MSRMNSHALAAQYLLDESGKTSLRDVEKAVELERFHQRVQKYSFNVPVFKLLISVVLILGAAIAIHHDR